MLFQPTAAHAASGTWVATASGNWSDGANWVGGNIADGAGSICFGPSLAPNGAVRTITVEAPRTIGGFSMNCNGALRTYVITGSTLTLAGFSPPEIFSLNGPTVVSTVLDGTAGVRLSAQNSGAIPSIYLNAVNIYTGDTEICLDGATKIAVVDAIPHGAGKGNVVLSNRGGNSHGYGTLDLLTNSITINGLSGAGGTVTTSSSEAGTSTLTIGDNDASATFSGAINDGFARQMALTKIGNGTETLSGANNYTGPTTVNAGTLTINGSISSPVSVIGGVFGGTGPIYGTVSVGAGGAIGAGSSVGKLTLAISMDLSAGGTNIWELGTLTDNSTGTPGTDFDLIDYQSVSSSFDLTDASLIVDVSAVNTADPFWGSTRTWTIITSFGQTGGSNFKAVEVRGSTPAGTFTTANNGTTVELTFTPGAVPFTPPKPKVTSVVPTSPTSVTVNYTNTLAGTNYVVQYRTNLNTTNWISLAPVLAGGTTSSSTDTPPAGSAHRYYRVYGQF